MIGCIIAYAGQKIPQGWLPCKGQILQSKNADGTPTAYDALHNVIGNAYGEGSEVGSFKLPDLTQRFVEGANGNLNIKVEDGIADHSHTFTGSTSAASGIPTGTGYNTSGNHTHTRGTWDITMDDTDWFSYYSYTNWSGATWDGPIKITSYNNSTGQPNQGGDGYYGGRKIDASKNWSGNTSDPGSHSHSVTASGTISTITGTLYNSTGIVQPKSVCLQYIIKYK